MYLYEQAFTHYRFGVGSAIAWLLFLLIIAISLVNVALVSRMGRTSRKAR
jgi:cellobiose transport system permease protein